MKLLIVLMCCILLSIYGRLFVESSNCIAQANVAPEGFAPYQCSIQLNRKHFCGCSIISNKYILTAAHCLQGKCPEQIEVLVGTQNLCRGGTYYKADQLIVHEKFNTPLFANDIGLIQVKKSIEFSDAVQPIELATEDVPPGTTLYLTGFGRLDQEIGFLPQITFLQQIGAPSAQLGFLQMNSMSLEMCAQSYMNTNAFLNANQLCAGASISGGAACTGDSGGPLVLRSDNNVQQVGVVSYGIACSNGFPDVFARLSAFNQWIIVNTA